MKRRPTQDIQRSDTHAAALRATDSPVRGILNRLMQAAPAPLDCGGLLSFCVGAASLCDIAAGLLKQPKPEFLMLRDECKALAATCIARFEAAGQTDAEGASYSYKTSHPAWAAVVEAGDHEDAATSPAAAALAVELCVSLAERKRIAVAFASETRIAMGNDVSPLGHGAPKPRIWRKSNQRFARLKHRRYKTCQAIPSSTEQPPRSVGGRSLPSPCS